MGHRTLRVTLLLPEGRIEIPAEKVRDLALVPYPVLTVDGDEPGTLRVYRNVALETIEQLSGLVVPGEDSDA
jgi:hypothetical protein